MVSEREANWVYSLNARAFIGPSPPGLPPRNSCVISDSVASIAMLPTHRLCDESIEWRRDCQDEGAIERGSKHQWGRKDSRDVSCFNYN
ncbi:hypothetical protein DY000_02024099 [Brassica cretica]|uniref:Uncharacterized protein n=1 Tax=Brassica cretica TaxID=69181 RepID=A0ABQ7E417_BRACR|nr:hypothetical protein DY000_02024099 [Brassica cretica]